MQAQANEAGPELGREARHPASLEAAGPAGPRLIIEEVTSRLGAEEVEVRTALALGQHRFVGTAAGSTGQHRVWELAAAASVAAMQQCLQQLASDPTTPQVQLLDTAAHTTGIGQEYIAAAIRVIAAGQQTDLLGSALVRNDRSRTAVAAALDAGSRYLARFSQTGISQLDPSWERGGIEDPAPKESEEGAVVSEQRTEEAPRIRAAGAATESASGPAVAARPPPPGFPAVGVVIDPALVYASAVDSDGAALAHAQRANPAGEHPQVALGLAIEAVREVADAVQAAEELTSIGLALNSCLDGAPETHLRQSELHGWHGGRAPRPFADEFSLPTAVIGSADAAAFAEFSFGAAQGIPDILYVRVGADIELGLLVRGSLLPMSQTLAGGGHMVIDSDGPRCVCGDYGCWQALAGTDALVARVVAALRGRATSAITAAVQGELDAITPPLVVRMAAAGDAVARRALQETGRHFAVGLANLIALFGPQAVLVDGQPPQFGTALLRAAEGALKSSARARRFSQCVLLTPEMGESAAALGAAAWAARSAS